MTYNLLDLFSGIGGFSLGLERSGGFKTVAFCEIDLFCCKVLEKHWPEVPIYDDIRTLTAARLASDRITVDAICGGFPCQDISVAGKGAGIDGARSGLWSEYARLVGELRPKYVIVENVAALLGRGLERVLGDLAALRYDAEWHCIPASAVGAPHLRDRVWIVAYPERANGGDCQEHAEEGQRQPGTHTNNPVSPGLSTDVRGQRIQGIISKKVQRQPAFSWCQDIRGIADFFQRSDIPEPLLWRIDDGLSDRVDAIGNAVVPQIPEMIGCAIIASEQKPA